MNRNRLIAIFLLALSLEAASDQALAQQPASLPNDTNDSARAGDALQQSNLLAQAHQKRRRSFILLPENRNPNLTGPMFSITPAAAPPPVTGSGTLGRLTKWTGFTNSNSAIGDSTIYEDKFGKVGIGTDSPPSKLTVAGLIESKGTDGGVKFPDGTVQTTAGIAPTDVVKSLNGLNGDLTLAEGTNITLTQAGNTLTIAATNAPTMVEPVQIQLRHVSGEQSFTVPSGKRLVIEHVSGFFQNSIVISDRMFLPLSTKVSGVQFDHSLVFEAASLGRGGSLYYIDKPVRLYADPGTVVGVPAPVVPEFRLVLSGHYVAVP